MRTLYKQNGETNLPGGVDLIFTMDEEGNITMDQGIYEVESGTSLIEEGMLRFIMLVNNILMRASLITTMA